MAKGAGSGFRIVAGYKFPADATDEEISRALKNLQDPNAPKMSELPKSQKPQILEFKNIWAGPEGLFEGKFMPEGGESSVEFPSQASMLEVLPGAGAAAGAMFAGPPGAAVGGGGGEIARQVIRKMLGLAPATGNIQKWTGMDPEGLPASLTGAIAESATAGAGEQIISKLAASKFPDYLRKKAIDVFAGMFPGDEATRAAMTRKITPIADELPVGSRRQIQRAALEAEKKTGQKVADIYNVDVPASFQPVVDRLANLSKSQIRRGKGELHIIDPQTGVDRVIATPENIKNPALQKAYDVRREAMRNAEESTIATAKPATIRDLYEARQTADEMLRADKQLTPGKATKELTPTQQALFEERMALRRELHDPVTWSGGKSQQAVSPVGPQKPSAQGPQLPVQGQSTPEGEAAAAAAEAADLAHAGWKTVQRGARGEVPAFLARWFVGRSLGGVTGNIAGAVAGKPSFWRSLTSKQLMQMSKAIKSGDEATAFRIFNAAVNDYQGANEPKQ